MAVDLADHDARLGRASLTAALRGRGVRVGTERAGELLASLRAEREEADRDSLVGHRTIRELTVEDRRGCELAWVGTRL